MLKKLILLLVLVAPLHLFAQDVLTGNVFDNGNRSLLLEDATVKNLTTQVVALTDKDGHFTIKAKKGDLVTFAMVGYKTDTLYLINMFPKNIFLVESINSLREVDISTAKVSPYLGDLKDPDAKPARAVDIDKNRGGVRFGLGFGKMRKEQAKVAALEENEQYQEEITKNFNANYIKALVKFEGSEQDLKDFLSLFRPTVEQVKAQRPFNYDYYSAQAYQTWLKLPVSQRKLPALPKIKAKQ